MAASDYTTTGGTLTFAPGETSKTVMVPVTANDVDEPDEIFSVTLSASTNATVVDGEGTGTITDDEGAPTLSIDDATVIEASGAVAEFTVTLSAVSAQAVTVAYATADGTAVAASDYTTTGGTLTFTPGETSKTVMVPVTADDVDEPDEIIHRDAEQSDPRDVGGCNVPGPCPPVAVQATVQGTGVCGDRRSPVG